jgi:hypothetical protein
MVDSEAELLVLVRNFIEQEQKSDKFLLEECQDDKKAKIIVEKTSILEQSKLISAAIDAKDLEATENLLVNGVSPDSNYLGFNERLQNKNKIDGNCFSILRNAINKELVGNEFISGPKTTLEHFFDQSGKSKIFEFFFQENIKIIDEIFLHLGFLEFSMLQTAAILNSIYIYIL